MVFVNTYNNFEKKIVILSLFVSTIGEPQKQIFGQSWDFVPTGLTPPPPRTLGHQKLKKNLMFIMHFRLF